MKPIYSHPDIGMVHLAKNALANQGIESTVKGEYGQSVFGGATGIEAWVELWLEDADHGHKAAGIIQDMIDQNDSVDVDSKPWTCPSCGEEIGATFGVCWNCGTEQPEG